MAMFLSCARFTQPEFSRLNKEFHFFSQKRFPENHNHSKFCTQVNKLTTCYVSLRARPAAGGGEGYTFL